MKYVFFGTPEFAAIILEKLVDTGFIPAAVVCNPDRPVGRKKIITPPPVKQVIRNEKLEIRTEILQPEQIDSSLISQLSSLKPDIFIVAAYSKILPKGILEIPRLGVIGVHPSLLPRFRGSSPIQSVILSGDHETGVSFYLMDEKMDHGKILKNEKLEIRNEDDYESLSKKLAELSGESLIKILPEFLDGEIKPVAQNEAEATYTKKFSSQDAFIKPEDLAAAEAGNLGKASDTERKIRALNPEPGVWTYTKALKNGHTRIKENKRLKLLEAEITGGKFVLRKIQFEGEKPKLVN